MSEAILREAATTIRDEWGTKRGSAWSTVQNFHLAVADWLDATAREFDALGNPNLSAHPKDGRRTAALAVAAAYLGRDA